MGHKLPGVQGISKISSKTGSTAGEGQSSGHMAPSLPWREKRKLVRFPTLSLLWRKHGCLYRGHVPNSVRPCEPGEGTQHPLAQTFVLNTLPQSQNSLGPAVHLHREPGPPSQGEVAPRHPHDFLLSGFAASHTAPHT